MTIEPEPPNFQYSPLRGPDAIRLLIIEPGQPDSPIHCRLIHAALSECQDVFNHYTALSYVWGDATQKRTIFVNALPFEVTSNLFDALHDLRHDQGRLQLWADAICIDQSNLEERASQVELMRQIYSFAAFTVIYLGTSNAECDEAMDAVVETKLDYRLSQIIESQILTRPWFTRVWVYQELVLSRMPLVQCGQRRVKWDRLHEAFLKSHGTKQQGEVKEDPEMFLQGKMDVVDKSPPNQIKMTWDSSMGKNRSVSVESGTTKAARMFSDMHAARERKKDPQSLLSVLISRRGCGVSDVRDIIFGHLAVADLPSKGNEPPCPKVDYHRSVTEVFTDTARYIVQNSEVKDKARYLTTCMDTKTFYHVLCQAGAVPNSHSLEGLSSWMPDWSVSLSNFPPVFPPSATSECRHSRFDDDNIKFDPESRYLDGRVLTARFWKVGELCYIQSVISDLDLTSDPQMYKMLDAVEDCIRCSPGKHWNDDEYLQDESTASSLLLGRRIAENEHGGLSLVPQDALSQDVIYALPLKPPFWGCFVLRPLPYVSKVRDICEGCPTVSENRDWSNNHFTLVGQALVERYILENIAMVAINAFRRPHTFDILEYHDEGEIIYIH
ncbi:heterokaryon incompatibility protein-domain-containing protein [Cadophora sp. MPI-SDFR-AT-0126]|nr:heterokaryon incompatibility protein-domain-containing protein [Leotiomycetes sp. MPI-SDFR-AT-0126]